MSRFLAILVGGLFAASASGASPDPKDLTIPPEELSKARELVHKLGSEVFRDREDANAELLKMGRKARQALLEAASSDPDPEVRFRCSRLLPHAGADDLKARLDTFLADADGKFDHDLPGLKQFRKLVGGDEKARSLFVEVIKSPYNLELLQAVERGDTEGGRAIADRRALMYSNLQHRNVGGRIVQPTPIPLSDIACLLFAEALVPSKDIPRTGIWAYVTGVTFLQQPPSNEVLQNGNNKPHADAYKRIVASWLETRDDVQDLNQLPYIAGQLLKGFPQSNTLLRRIMTTEGVQGYAKGQAMQYLVQDKGKDEIPFLKKLLTDDTMVTQVWFQMPNQPNQPPQMHQCLVRDVALAHLIILTGQKMPDYGYSFPPNSNPGAGQPAAYGNYAFTTDEARSAALVKFGFWQLRRQINPEAKEAEPKKDTPPQPPQPQPGIKPGIRPVPPAIPAPTPPAPVEK
jgi:hypothetical protein